MKNSTHDHSCIRALKSDFAAFRRRNRSNTRIPADLRRRILSAVAQGIAPSQIITALGLTEPQIARWRQRELPTVTDNSPPRVLNVVSDLPVSGMPAGLRVSYEASRLLLEFSF